MTNLRQRHQQLSQQQVEHNNLHLLVVQLLDYRQQQNL
jgi:hypothetical protein